MIMMSVLLALALQAPVTPVASAPLPPASGPPSCFVYSSYVRANGRVGIPAKQFYNCESVDPWMGLVDVEQKWFKAHCRRIDHLSSGAIAECDAYAPAVARVDHPAAPSKFLNHLKVIGVTAAGVGIVAICTYGGGCGFMGGR